MFTTFGDCVLALFINVENKKKEIEKEMEKEEEDNQYTITNVCEWKFCKRLTGLAAYISLALSIFSYA